MKERARRKAITFNAELLEQDMAGKGWLAIDLARRAGVSHMSVGRFLNGERRTARMAKKLAEALGKPLSRYIVLTSQEAVA